ncbi:DNA/RNA non-specific endonuclease [Actinomadura harenae]|uniref:DNA/RNA non-specific endonuclease n=1 Tax=Actinomadura harenae TaxID=2483351 RepID=UPI00131563AC|nr:DNA/RNA non-specific endonuclease [Actinomadura harenae]
MATRRTTRALLTGATLTAALVSPLTTTSASAVTAPPVRSGLHPAEQGPIDPAPCAEHLTPSHTYHADGATYRTDAQGRPERAEANDLTHSEAVRGSCQGKAGHMAGVKGYDGGHLIAATLHGVDRRYDLVPQWASVNRGAYMKFESGAKRCLKQPGGRIHHYRIKVTYPEATTLVPDAFHTDVEVSTTGHDPQELKLDFPNRELSRSEYGRLRGAYERLYKAAGCGEPEADATH